MTPQYNANVTTPDGPALFKGWLYADGAKLALVVMPAKQSAPTAAEAWGGTPKSLWTMAAYPAEKVTT